METKVCKICGQNKPFEKFRKRKSGIFSPTCKKCYHDAWYSKNPEYQKNYDKKRWREKKDIETSRTSKWRKENLSRWVSERMKNDVLFSIKIKIRWRIKTIFNKNGYTKKSKTSEILGIDYLGFKEYIENQFKEGMSWSNHGLWHLDHKVPLSWAKSEEEIIELNHYTNFQPLWANENLTKGNKYSD